MPYLLNSWKPIFWPIYHGIKPPSFPTIPTHPLPATTYTATPTTGCYEAIQQLYKYFHYGHAKEDPTKNQSCATTKMQLLCLKPLGLRSQLTRTYPFYGSEPCEWVRISNVSVAQWPLHFEFSFVIVISGKAYIKIVFGPNERSGMESHFIRKKGMLYAEGCVWVRRGKGEGGGRVERTAAPQFKMIAMVVNLMVPLK